MAIKKYDGLDSNYLPNDGSVKVALPENAIELGISSNRISQAVDLSEYSEISFIVENSDTTSIDYLEMIGTESTDSTLEVVKDVNASSGYALKMTGAQKLVFGTPISYVPDILKRITLKAKLETGNTNTLHASVVAYKNGDFIDKSGNPSLDDYVDVVDTSELSDSYSTMRGYIKNTGSSYTEPAINPDSPSELPSGTDEIALLLESDGGIFYIDVISLEEVENSIRNIPDGEGVYNSAQNFNTRNDRISTTPNNPVVSTPSSYVLNSDGTVDIEFTWTFDNTEDAGNIDGFAIYEHSATDDSVPVFDTQDAVYIDRTSRSYTIRSVVINKYYTLGVQAYRAVDPDVDEDEIIKSSIVQTTPYRPSAVVPSTTTFNIQPNVDSYLGSEVLGSVYIHGFYPNNTRGDIDGRVLYNSNDTDLYVEVPKGAVDCTDFTFEEDSENIVYLVLTGGVVKAVTYSINNQVLQNDTETVNTGIVIGEVEVEYSSNIYTIDSVEVYSEAKTIDKVLRNQTNLAWKYLSEASDATDWASRAEDLGLENVFTFLAAYEAFIYDLTAQNVFITNAVIEHLSIEDTVDGVEYSISINSTDGIKFVRDDVTKFHVSPDGSIVARDASLVDATVSGAFTSEEFSTQKSGTGSTVDYTKTSWTYIILRDMPDAIEDYIDDNDITEDYIDGENYMVYESISGYLNGDSFSKVRISSFTPRCYDVCLSSYVESNTLTMVKDCGPQSYDIGNDTQLYSNASYAEYNSTTIWDKDTDGRVWDEGSDELGEFSSLPVDVLMPFTGTFDLTKYKSEYPGKHITETANITSTGSHKIEVLSSGAIEVYNEDATLVASFNSTSKVGELDVDIDVESTLAGIKVQNVMPTDGSSYDIGLSTNTFRNIHGDTIYGGAVYGAVGNDFADWIEVPCNWEYGKAVIYKGQYFGIPSDTAGLYAGREAKGKMPRAVAGFILAYVDKQYKVNTKLTYKNNGSLTKKRWWSRKSIVATYYMQPRDNHWNDIIVNDRHIVKVVI